MSKNRTCWRTGKVLHRTEAKAEKQVQKLGTGLRSYFCKSCQGWHLTRQALVETNKEDSREQ